MMNNNTFEKYFNIIHYDNYVQIDSVSPNLFFQVKEVIIPAYYDNKQVYLPNNCSGLFSYNEDNYGWEAQQGYLSITKIDLSNIIDVSNVVDISSMFQGLTSLEEVIFGDKWAYNNEIRTLQYLFYNCGNLTTVDFENIPTYNVTNMNGVFSLCYNLRLANLTSWDFTFVTCMDDMFSHCTALNTVLFPDMDAPMLKTCIETFYECVSLQTVVMRLKDTTSLEDISGMFSSCRSLEEIDLSSLVCNNIWKMNYTFAYCSALKTLKMSGTPMGHLETEHIFAECRSLGYMQGVCQTLVSEYHNTVFAEVIEDEDLPF